MLSHVGRAARVLGCVVGAASFQARADDAPAPQPALEIDIAEPTVDSEPVADGPQILVTPPTRDGAPLLPQQRLLITALTKHFGARVLDAKSVIGLQAERNVTSSDLRLVAPSADATSQTPLPPAALKTLGDGLRMPRAVIADITPSATVVVLFKHLAGTPGLTITVPRKAKAPLDAAWANAVASEVQRLGKGMFEADESDAPPSGASDVDAEIAAERARAQAAADARAEEERRKTLGEPFVMAALGGGVAQRFFDVTGPAKGSLTTVRQGLVPVFSAYVTTSPLRIAPSMRSARYADLTVEAGYRHGFAVLAGKGTTRCTVDDDDVFVRAGYRVQPAENPWVPRVGLTATGELDRVGFRCDLPLLSTSYASIGGGLRITQPLLPRPADGTGALLELDAHIGARAIFLAADEGGLRPGVAAEAFVVARPWRFVLVRGGTRFTTAGASLVDAGGSSLVELDDKRVELALQAGVVF